MNFLSVLKEWFADSVITKNQTQFDLNTPPPDIAENTSTDLSPIRILEETKGQFCLSSGKASILVQAGSLAEVSAEVGKCLFHYTQWQLDLISKNFAVTLDQFLSEFHKVYQFPLIVLDAGSLCFSSVGNFYTNQMPAFLITSINQGFFDYTNYLSFYSSAKRTTLSDSVELLDLPNGYILVSHLLDQFNQSKLIISYIPRISYSSLHLFTEFKKYLKLWLQINVNSTAIKEKDFFTRIISGNIPSIREIHQYLTQIGLKTEKGYVVLYFTLPEGNLANSVLFIRQLEESTPNLKSFPDPYDTSSVVAIINIDAFGSKPNLHTMLHKAQLLSIQLGSSCYDTDYSNIASHYYWAKHSCSVINNNDTLSNIYETVFLSKLLSSVPKDDFIGLPSVLILQNYDKSHSSSHLHILKTYFSCNLSKTRTASKLGIHRNTLQKHLDKIRELTNIDIERQEHRLAIEVYLYMLDHGMMNGLAVPLPPANRFSEAP